MLELQEKQFSNFLNILKRKDSEQMVRIEEEESGHKKRRTDSEIEQRERRRIDNCAGKGTGSSRNRNRAYNTCTNNNNNRWTGKQGAWSRERTISSSNNNRAATDRNIGLDKPVQVPE